MRDSSNRARIEASSLTRGFPCAVAGLPKSIDNDILLIDKCFGYNTAVAEAEHAIQSAVVEARSQLHGVGVVKLSA